MRERDNYTDYIKNERRVIVMTNKKERKGLLFPPNKMREKDN